MLHCQTRRCNIELYELTSKSMSKHPHMQMGPFMLRTLSPLASQIENDGRMGFQCWTMDPIGTPLE